MTSLVTRPETEQDEGAIRELTRTAFLGKPYAGGDEQDVIDRLRHCGVLTRSLVVESGGQLVAQVTFSPATEAGGTGPWFALGPVSVSPDRQGEGIGAMLIEHGLRELRERGALGCILTGDPAYYERFGFEVKADLAPAREPGEYFQVHFFGETRPSGPFEFHPAFYDEVA